MFELDQSKVFVNNQEVRNGMCNSPLSALTALTAGKSLRGSQMLSGDNADSEGVGRLENANPLGGQPMRVRHSTEITSTHRGVQPPGS
jgi:hypothetical protein